MDLMERQLALEEEMRTDGVARYQRMRAHAVEKARETNRPSVKRLMDGAHERVVAAIHGFMVESRAAGAGRRHDAVRAFEEINNPDLLAHIALRAVLDAVSMKRPVPKVAMAIGRMLDDERQYMAIKAQAPNLYGHLVNQMKNVSNPAQRRKSASAQAGKIGVEYEAWKPARMLHVGAKLLELVMAVTDLVEETRDGHYGDRYGILCIQGTEQAKAWLETEDGRLQWRSPSFMPTLVPPKPWSALRGGGYHSDRLAYQSLMRTSAGKMAAQGDLTQVYAALNAVQDTAWSINKGVLSVMTTLWNNDSELAVIPRPNPAPLPNRPLGIREDVKRKDLPEAERIELDDWIKAKAQTINDNAKNEEERRVFLNMLRVAQKFEDEEAIYFPHNLDWRGRIYPIPLYLNPQGDDAQRGLLQFANGVPIVDEEGARWLAIHGAGLWGIDKVSFDERVNWIVDHQDEIIAAATDPLANRFWCNKAAMDEGKPWQALAFCFDWAGLNEGGYGFVSHLPVQMDGSCNGLQNFSAILRDPVGGAAVNLVPAERPSDIYSQVAELVTRRVERDAAGDGDVARIARGWVGNVNRKVCKRPVMTLAYGASRFGFRDQVMVDTVKPWRIKAEKAKDGSFPWEGSGAPAAQYLGGVIWECVGEVVVAAHQAMGFLQECAKRMVEAGQPIEWTTPIGLTIRQQYFKDTSVRVKVQFRSHRIDPRLNEDTEEMDKRENVSAISPNYIHSMDAAHLMRTVNAAHSAGVRSFSMIHDSFGTHAGNAQALGHILRDEFVRMYKDKNWLDDFAFGLALEDAPPLPKPGSLDLDQILASDFFFA